MAIQNHIKEYRASQSMTQGQLADLVEVSRQTIIAMEKGNYTPSLLLALRLARVFGVPVEKLFSITAE